MLIMFMVLGVGCLRLFLLRRDMVLGPPFVRVDVVRSGKDQRVLKRLVNNGWEVGLHLINTVGDSRLPPPMSELELLQSFIGQQVYGVTPCGKTIGFKGEVTWGLWILWG